MKNSKAKSIWLIGFCVLVVMMIAVGGATRLTRSGLSIVEWKPLSGIIPPLTDSDWQQNFTLYQATPEYQQVNRHFGLEDYKKIFFWEYLHRVLGRLIFLYVLIPGLILWRKKIVTGNLVLLLAVLVASQGLIGWLMVKSGLNRDPHVSPYMLALHFFSALFVLITAYYHFCKGRPNLEVSFSSKQKNWFSIFGVLLLFQVFWGCLTSGLKAGYAFNTYPLMGGEFFPAGGLIMEPILINFFENSAAVQWTHRWLGIVVLIVMMIVAKQAKDSPDWKLLKSPFLHLVGVIVSQVILGILTVVYGVPIWLAVAHQICGTLLVLTYFGVVFRLKQRRM